MDLSKTIKINNKFEISYGMILMTFLVTTFECLFIIAMNNWQFTPIVFVLIANAIGLLRKKKQDSLEERVKRLEESLKNDITKGENK